MNYRQPFTGDWPITQRFGEKITDPKGHTGIDYACPTGTPILASAAGTVVNVLRSSAGYGNAVTIRHSDGNTTLYAHLSSVAVKTWQTVGQGEVIGSSGSTGNSTGPHLHFEARGSDGKAFDPMKLLLMTVFDVEPAENSKLLKGPLQLGHDVQIVAPAGAWGWSQDFSSRQTVFPQGTQLTFTGETEERNGYTYCEVYPAPVTYWVAVHDGVTQILDNDV